MKRKLLAILLALMVLSLLSTAAFAAEAEESAPTALAAGNVAELNGTQYTSLQQALLDAKSGDTVTLLENVTSGPSQNIWITKSGITLDLNGKTLTAGYQLAIGLQDSVQATVKNGTLTGGSVATVYNMGSLTVDNCNVIAGETPDIDAVLAGKVPNIKAVQNNGNNSSLTLKGTTVTAGTSQTGIADFSTNGTITLNGCNVTGDWFAITHNGSTAGFTMIATDSTITAFDGKVPNACAIYVSASKGVADQHGMNNIELTNCTVTGPTGIEGKFTNMTLNDCDITATAEAISFEQYNNGSTALGFAVVSTDNTMKPDAPKPEATITINGGNYDGLIALSQFEEVTKIEGFKEASITVAGGAFSGDVSAYLVEGIQNVEYNTVLKAPTCTTSGIGKLVQIVNGQTTNSYYVIPAGHKPAEAVKEHEVAATCTKAGSYDSVVYCSVCNEELSRETVTVEALGHTYDKGAVTKEATCGEDGKKTYTCTACEEGTEGHTKTEVIPATGKHTYKESYTDATCTEPAMAGEICEACGAKTEMVPVEGSEPLGHDWVLDDTAEGYVAPTCVKDGVGTYKCSRCDMTKTETIPATGEHTEELIPGKEPTCTEAGLTDGVKCSVCDAILMSQEEIPATGHTPDEAKHIPATCTENGKAVTKCAVCGETIEEADLGELDPAKGHKEEAIPAVPATCGTTGRTEGKKCSACGVILVKQEETPIVADAHNYKLDKTLKEAACTTTGIGKYVCEYCKDSKYAVIPAGHSWKDGEVTTEPTCTEAGEKTYTCSKCHETKTEEIAALGHNYNDGEVTIEPTCGKAGVKTYTCENGCGDSYTEEIPATGEHEYEEKLIEATCTEPAKVGEICSVCGAEGETTVVEGSEPLGHNWWLDDTEYVAPTCVEDGVGTYVCLECAVFKTETIPATGKHTERVVDGKAPTCTEPGLTDGVKCSVCDAILMPQEEIPATGHTPGEAEYIQATCTENGKAVTKCTVCGETIEEADLGELDPAKGHKEQAVEDVPATCSTSGLTGKVICSNCGEVLNEGTETAIDPNAHEYKLNEPPLKAATCTATGIGKYICQDCGAIKYAVIEKLPHQVDEANGEITKEPTCNEEGIVTFKCKVCGETVERPLMALGHEWIEDLVSEDNTYVYKECERCGEIEIVHRFEEECKHENTEIKNAKEATCTAAGYTGDTVCVKCGETVKAGAEIPMKEHAWDAGKATTEATCTEAGVKTFTCAACGATRTEEIKALGHTEVTVPGKAATCTEDGLTEGKVCSVCETVLVEQEAIPASHTEEVLVAKEATCTEKGQTAGTKCSVCGTILKAPEEIPALGHKEEVVDGKAATCTEAGMTDGVKCSVCGETLLAQEEIPALGHTEVTIPGKEATCTEAGLTEGKKCSVCETVLEEQKEIPALGHKEVAIPGKDATCAEAGLTEGKKCSVCETVLEEQKEIAKLPHTPEVIPSKEATCTETGLTEGVKCSVCGEILTAQKEVAAKGHDEVAIPGKEATCTETGLTEGKECSICGEILKAQEEIPALGHTEVTVDGKEATCTETGLTEGKKCSVCGTVLEEQKEIPATGHNFVYERSYIDEAGKAHIVYKCTLCGEETEELPVTENK